MTLTARKLFTTSLETILTFERAYHFEKKS